MERKKASDYPQEILDIFHLYVHGDIDRRGFIDRAAKFVGAVSAAAMLEELTPNFAWAQQVPKGLFGQTGHRNRETARHSGHS